MASKFKEIFAPVFNSNKYDRRKILLLACCFFMLIGAFSILKPLKNPIFFSLVGKEWKPYTRFISIPILAIAMLFYSAIVDRLRRHKVLILFTIAYSIINIFFAFILNHPVYGLSNTDTSCWRFLGWIFYIYLDLYQAFVITTFWAFTTSICTPNEAKSSYGFLVACSKVAGISTPLLSLFLLDITKTSSVCILIAFTSIFLLLAAYTIWLLKRTVPGYHLHGYEAVYKVEKEKAKKEKTTKKGFVEWFISIFEGIILIVKRPYVFGIFFITCSYELISEVLDYHFNVWLSVAKANRVTEMSAFNLYYTSAFQGLGLIFALFGTTWALKHLGVKKALIITPIATITLMSVLWFNPTLTTIVVVMIILRALNSGFNTPVREILFIPTVKDIKFKSRAWINSFGRTFSKSSGSALNIMAQTKGLNFALGILFAIAGVWSLTTVAVGEKYTKTVESGGIIE